VNAGVITRTGDSPRAIDYPDPALSTDAQVLVEVEAAALNAVDLHIASGRHRAAAPRVPYVPGVEAVGEIVAGQDVGLRVRVAAAAGLAPGIDGGLAEFVVADRAACIPVPAELDSVTAAAIGIVGTSADIALGRAALAAGESVLVLGATGPLGNAFVQLARPAGAGRVIAAGRNIERLARLRSADSVITLDETPLDEQLAPIGGPVDLVVDPLWGAWAQPALTCLKPGGRYLNVGAAAGDGTPFQVEWLRAQQVTLVGFSATKVKPADIIASYERVAALAATGTLVLPITTYRLAEIDRAWDAQASSPGKKIIVLP
jgi:NADPH:quinone reductase-like Zn-dependent oxidoreductase